MVDDYLNIGELADAAGVTRRAVRFYVQRGLLPAPAGRGRGSHYTSEHLQRLRRIHGLQDAGHSLEAVKRILAGEADDAPSPAQRGRRSRSAATVTAELWTRIRLAEGVELHVDVGQHELQAEDLLRARQAVAHALRLPGHGAMNFDRKD